MTSTNNSSQTATVVAGDSPSRVEFSATQRLLLRAQSLKTRLREWIEFDSILFRVPITLLGVLGGAAAWIIGNRRKAVAIYGRLHRSAYSTPVSRAIARLVHAGTKHPTDADLQPRFLTPLYRSHLESLSPTPATQKFFEHPEKVLGPLAMVLKEHANGEKGVIALQYSYIFPVFARLFDLEAVSRRYYIVLEPSWCGYCDLDILSYASFDFPVFVEASEPRDAQFIEGINSNLKVVPIAANWWIDHRVFRPLSGVRKDVDIFMNAAWASYKRHERFFAALGRLRIRNVRPRVVMVGFPLNLTKADILRSAAMHGVLDQIECYENLSVEQVNAQLNRAKVSILWSRREGFNRAVIENMFAGVPCILRDGFNYGYRHPYINDLTGRFASERDLPDILVDMIERHEKYKPREWVMANMSCQRATEILRETIGREARLAGEPWSGDMAVKVAGVSALRYWDQQAAGLQFAADYAFLRTAIRRA